MAYTVAEKVALVEEYPMLRYGQKTVWLKAKGIAQPTITRWRRGYLYGDLEQDLIPRNTEGMSVEDGAKFQELELALARERSARLEEQAIHRAEVERLEAINQTLGKAIGLLHDHAAKREPTDES